MNDTNLINELNEELSKMSEVNGYNVSAWSSVQLSDVVKINPKLPIEIKDESLEVSFLPMKLVEEESNEIHLTETRKYSAVKKGFTPMVNDDVIFAKITPCMENGKIAIVHSLKNGIAFGSTEFHVLRCNGKLNNRFLFHYLVQKRFRQEAEFNMTGAVGQRRVPKRFLEETLIPLPSLKEQQQIVSKIEELFSELDKSIEQLKTAQQQLKVYRQSVLKWAFEGKLTNDNVKEGELPDGWQWKKLKEVGNAIDPQPSHRTPPVSSDGIPYVSTKDFDFENDHIDFSGARRVSKQVLQEHLERYELQEGDFVIGKIGTIGKPVRIVLPQKYTLSANIVLIQPRTINRKFLYYFFQTNHIEREFQKGSKATTQAAFGIQKVRELEIPYPPTNEQQSIVQEIESRLSVADKLEETIANSLQQAEALRQSILKNAFDGQLI